MISLLIGGAYGILLVIAFSFGVKIGDEVGRESGRDSCATDAVKIMSECCCEDCMKRIREYLKTKV